MPAKVDITNQRFGRLLAINPTDRRSAGKIVWKCLCECGNECLAAINHLRDGRRVSCGCAKEAGKQIRKKPSVHGHHVGNKPSPTYYSWSSMRTRCTNPKSSDFSRYGGRGITICDRWELFENFLADMGIRQPKTTLERVDVNGPYCLENCVWATKQEQDRNKRTNRYLTAFGRTQILSDWSREFGIPKKTITDRLSRGLRLDEALTSQNTQISRTP